MYDELFDKQPCAQKTSAPPPEPGTGPVEDFGSFGWLPVEQARAAMLELRHANGLIVAYSYAWLESAEFNPSEGIALTFCGKTVRLVGRNLNADVRPNVRLFQGILCHRVPWVQEVDEADVMEESDEATVIERIEGDRPS